MRPRNTGTSNRDASICVDVLRSLRCLRSLVSRRSGVRFAFTPRLLSLEAMADMEELAIVRYAGPPQPIMIRYMLDEAKGNNVNARTLKVWDCSLHR